MPTIHLIIPPTPSNTRQRAACGVKKGAGMEEADFRKEMKVKVSLLQLCEKCKKALTKSNKSGGKK